MTRRFRATRRFLWSLLAIGWVAFVAVGLSRMQTNIEDLRPWLPNNTPERRNYEWFVDTFGADDMVIVSWDGCTLDDPRLAALTAALRKHERKYIREVVSPTETLDQIIDETRLPREAAIDRLQGFLIGPDGETTCLLAYFTTAGMQDRLAAVRSVIGQALTVCDLTPEELHLGGRSYLGYYTSRLTIRSLTRLSIPVVILSTLLAWFALQDLGVLLITLCSAGFAALTSLVIVPWCGFELSGVLTALPSLIYVIATSGSIHLANYAAEMSHEPTWETDVTKRTQALRRKAFVPCLLSSASTGLGTLSLMWSQFPAIRDFGLFGSIGLVITFLVHMLFVPLLLAWRVRSQTSQPDEKRSARGLMALLALVLRKRGLVITSTLLLTVLMGLGLFRLEGRFQISELFTSDSEFMHHTQWLEEHLGPVDATEVVIGFDQAHDEGLLQRIEHVQSLEHAIGTIPEVKSTYSAATLLPDLSRRTSVLSRLFTRSALQRHSDELRNDSLVAQDEGTEHWRITLRTSLLDDPNRDHLKQRILAVVDDQTSRWDQRPAVIVTGATQVFEESKDDVVRDFVESLLLAYVLIFGLMVLALRDLIGGLLAMIPNAIPSIVVFGGLGWIDGAIDMGMTVAACIALGIAVDDTSHLLMSYRHARRTRPRRSALLVAVRECGPAMCQTSIICGIALLPYLWAELIYLSRFGLVIPLLMAAALIGDLLLLPALVASSAGRYFDTGLPTLGDAPPRPPLPNESTSAITGIRRDGPNEPQRRD